MISGTSGTCRTPWWTSTSRTRRSSSILDENIFFSDVIHHLSQVFDGEMIADDFKYLKDMLDTMVNVDIKVKEEFMK